MIASAAARPGLTAPAGPSIEDVGLERVTGHGWRVTDARLSMHDPFRVLGFIEYRAERFEVMQIGAGFEWHLFGTLQDAVAHIVRTAEGLAQQRLDLIER